MWIAPDIAPDIAPNERRAGREQNLFIGQMKHLYVLKDGTIKGQYKVLDPRIPGKHLITRFVLLDVDSGSVYGECHTTETAKDLAGFLARAWSVKPDHPMHGLPECLNVPQLVHKDRDYRLDIERVVQPHGVMIGPLPRGFDGGVHAVRLFDEQIRSLLWEFDKPPLRLTLDLAQACSAGASARIRNWFMGRVEERWTAVPAPPESFFAAVDKLYKEPGAWRRGAFEPVLKGLRQTAGV